MKPRTSARLLVLVVFGAELLAACDGCGRKADSRRATERRDRVERTREPECAEAAECADDEPCTLETCEDGACVSSPAAEGTSCEDGDPCNGVAKCSAKGVCVAGHAPAVDDGNACTTDRCDPTRGVLHEPVAVDDGDACTVDACDPLTGSVTHTEVLIDDGDDCTLDGCDPRSGVVHRRANPSYTCATSCGPGYHAASRTPSAECGSRDALRTFCLPDCGPSFHSCDPSCPAGYQKKSEARSTQCGTGSPTMAFCVKG